MGAVEERCDEKRRGERKDEEKRKEERRGEKRRGEGNNTLCAVCGVPCCCALCGVIYSVLCTGVALHTNTGIPLLLPLLLPPRYDDVEDRLADLLEEVAEVDMTTEGGVEAVQTLQGEITNLKTEQQSLSLKIQQLTKVDEQDRYVNLS